MTDQNPPMGGGQEPLPASRRPASVTLRGATEEADAAALMDPANQSLADALKILFKLVQLAMIVLGVLYVLSGFQSVKENEQGIRLLFGAKEGDPLDPGFRFSYPTPVGELLKIDTGEVTLELDSEFWVYLADERARAMKLSELTKVPSLNPEREGSVLTADGNVAHTRWTVKYQRDRNLVAEYAQNILPEAEKDIVRGAVKAAIVNSIASVTIDDLLKQSSNDAGSVAVHAKDAAQATLDRLKSGLKINQLLLTDKTPPLRVLENFAAVQAATSKASAEKDKADSDRRATLSAVAGLAQPVLSSLIDRYELATEKGDAAEKVALLTQIDGVLEGRETTVGDTVVPANRVSGEVTAILNNARRYRSEIVNDRRSELSSFVVKADQFKISPLVLVHREWSDAMRSFMDRDNVQVMALPPGTNTLALLINSDPSILKELEKARKLKENEAAATKRAEEQKVGRFKTETGLKASPD